MTIVATHQFEIRFSVMLGLSNIVPDIITPFTPLTTNINIENEGFSTAKYTLIFDGYEIGIYWDRVIFRSFVDASYSESNSIVEQAFFAIFNSIKRSKNFGEVKNCLWYSIYVNFPENPKHGEECVDDFLEKYYKKGSIENVGLNVKDLAVVIEGTDSGRQVNLHIGPYLGKSDLAKRKNVILNLPIDKQDEIGEMVELRIFELTDEVTFLSYKTMDDVSQKYLSRIWRA